MNKTFCYIHIPFCESKCKYCRFASVGNLQILQIQNYTKYLCKEISSTSTFLSIKEDSILNSIYFGGGTPAILNKNQFRDVLKTLRDKYNFTKDIEISLEATPQSITSDKLSFWIEYGVNRISIGIQSLNNKTLSEIGRKDNSEIFKALDIIDDSAPVKEGNISISVDFIIGLPYVKKGGVKNDIELLLNKYAFINHISVYMLEDYYEIEAEKDDSKYEKITYPNSWGKLGISEDDYLEEYIEIKRFLESKGIYSYEISNYSKIGSECKHNMAYWDHSNILAFGLGASGYMNNTRYTNSDNFKDYYSRKNILIDKLTKKDIFLEKVMFGLRTSGLEKDIFEKLNNDKIIYFISEKLLEKKSDKLILSDKAVSLLDFIVREII